MQSINPIVRDGTRGTTSVAKAFPAPEGRFGSAGIRPFPDATGAAAMVAHMQQRYRAIPLEEQNIPLFLHAITRNMSSYLPEGKAEGGGAAQILLPSGLVVCGSHRLPVALVEPASHSSIHLIDPRNPTRFLEDPSKLRFLMGQSGKAFNELGPNGQAYYLNMLRTAAAESCDPSSFQFLVR